MTQEAYRKPGAQPGWSDYLGQTLGGALGGTYGGRLGGIAGTILGDLVQRSLKNVISGQDLTSGLGSWAQHWAGGVGGPLGSYLGSLVNPKIGGSVGGFVGGLLSNLIARGGSLSPTVLAGGLTGLGTGILGSLLKDPDQKRAFNMMSPMLSQLSTNLLAPTLQPLTSGIASLLGTTAPALGAISSWTGPIGMALGAIANIYSSYADQKKMRKQNRRETLGFNQAFQDVQPTLKNIVDEVLKSGEARLQLLKEHGIDPNTLTGLKLDPKYGFTPQEWYMLGVEPLSWWDEMSIFPAGEQSVTSPAYIARASKSGARGVWPGTRLLEQDLFRRLAPVFGQPLDLSQWDTYFQERTKDIINQARQSGSGLGQGQAPQFTPLEVNQNILSTYKTWEDIYNQKLADEAYRYAQEQAARYIGAP